VHSQAKGSDSIPSPSLLGGTRFSPEATPTPLPFFAWKKGRRTIYFFLSRESTAEIPYV